MIRQFVPAQDLEVAHRAHLLGLLHPSGYRRQDDTLRRGARLPRYRGGDDRSWFERRQRLGESAAMAEQAEAIASALDAWPRVEGLLAPTIELTVACAAPAWPVSATRRPWRVVVAPRTAPGVVLVAALAGSLRSFLKLRAIPWYQRDLIAGHCAASLLVREPAFADRVDDLLRDIGLLFFPARAERARFSDELRDLVARHGDQPPGEIERLVDGLAKGRLDRLHRAWLRDFFTPRGTVLKDWVARQRQAC